MDISIDITLSHVFDIRIDFDRRWVFGPLPDGNRQGYTSVKSGVVEGPRLNGIVVPGSGADWALVHTDGTIELNAHYVLEADDGTQIYIRNLGYVRAPRPVEECGGDPDAARGYFRCTPYFRAPQGRHAWLNRTVIVGGGERRPAASPDEQDYSLFRYYAVG